ncbi:MAG: polyprenyl diphosphate synthase [Nanoarchaeota archaeon]
MSVLKPVSSPVPKHIGLIMDGNRRFAKRLMLKPWKGHEWGKEKVMKVCSWAKELGVEELTFYAFSIQNLNRPKKEFDYLMKVCKEGFKELLEKIDKKDRLAKDMQIQFIGRIHLFPKDIQSLMKEIMKKTRDNKKYKINFAMAYGGREEVMDAILKIAKEVAKGNLKASEINEELFAKNLYTPDEPDLIIRTGGEKRISNFLIWQGNYAELIFMDKMWPEFEKEDLIACIEEYGERERRFGR